MVSNAQTGPCLRHLLDSIHALKRQRKLQLTLIAALWSLLPEYNPADDVALEAVYTAENQAEKKRQNKVAFQKALGLREDPNAPLFYWPSRLDPIQKGPQLLTEIMYSIIHDYWDRDLQIAAVADGPFQPYFYDIIGMGAS